MKHIRHKLLGLGVMLLLCCVQLKAQDTSYITLPQAETVFLQKNLALLAEKYNINIAEAQVVQSKLCANPNFSATGNIYKPNRNKLFDVSNRTGEYVIAVQQLVTLAGKRNKQVKLAQTNVALAQNSFYDLLRTLRFSLRSDFYTAHYLSNSINAYQKQIESVNRRQDRMGWRI